MVRKKEILPDGDSAVALDSMVIKSSADDSPEADIEAVLSDLLNNYGTTLLRLCFFYLKDVHLAEDAVQDSFVKVYANYNKFNHASDIKTWVTRIAINICKNYLRSPWRKRIDDSAVLEAIPARDYTSGIEYDEIVRVIMALPAKYKDVILLYYYQQFKTREIADILRIPQATVSTRLGRAKRILKDKLGGFYYDDE